MAKCSYQFFDSSYTFSQCHPYIDYNETLVQQIVLRICIYRSVNMRPGVWSYVDVVFSQYWVFV